MVPGGRSGWSSPFDDMLEQNRKQFEDLYGGVGSEPAKESRSEGPRRRPASATSGSVLPRSVQTPSAALAAPTIDRSSGPVRFLNDRYGDGWRYEITKRRQQGDEVIVRCRLIVGDQNIIRIQSGRALIYQFGDAVEFMGSADGVAFTARSEDTSRGNATEDPVEAAFNSAVENALTKCAEML